jgi:membrane-bound lytic murein transglycosylase D
MDKTQLVRWQQYKVQKGDNLGYISRLFGMKIADIQSANNLRGNKLRVGQILIIPMPAGANPPEKQRQIEKASKPAEKNNNGEGNLRSYVVRNGDNLSSISRRFGISSQTLMEWNNLQNNKIAVGQRLYLQDPSKKTEKKETQAIVNKTEANGGSYVVKLGDNLWEIARIHGVTVQQILEWNPGIDKKIFPGMKIKVSP